MKAMLVTELIKGTGKGEGSRPGGNTEEGSRAEEEGPVWSLEGTLSRKESVLSGKGRVQGQKKEVVNSVECFPGDHRRDRGRKGRPWVIPETHSNKMVWDGGKGGPQGVS